MTKMSDDLKKTLGLLEAEDADVAISGEIEHKNHVPTVFQPKALSTQFEQDDSDKAHDYKKVRETLHELVDITSSAMAEALDLAKDTQHPRAFEVFNNLATTVREAAKDIMAIHKEMDEKKSKGDLNNLPSGASVTQNNFYMSTQEALDQIKKNKVIDIHE